MRSVIALFGTFLILGLGAAFAHSQGYSPETAVKKMRLAEGFAVKRVASEPLVRKPVALEFDDRGRAWVIQYLQYPNPAGLKRLRVDRYSRTVYDRIPEPPPRGPKGADRITILEETNAEGQATKAKDFIADLNLATGLAFGHGGVFVLQAPYLLFYPDRDRDDVPDGPPEVLLSGFGMEDASSVANSLTWGPDGWLYGCQGSTVTARIRGIEFQQGIWRYHPITQQFELFCEGGGNCWGLDFDERGELFYSTNVGGHVLVHGVQDAYYWKQFDKHGRLSNPYAFGYFDHVPHRHFRGGHVTVGGIVYQGDSFPDRFRGKFIAADLLGHALYWHDLEPYGSGFRSRHGGELLLANDTSFAPSDVTEGPDGSLYVCDWHDKRTAHPDPDAVWDRSKGRIYKIEFRGTQPYTGRDLRELSSAQLVALLSSKNNWLVRKARRILADRRDPEVIFPLRRLVLESDNGALALQALWALYVSGGFSEGFAIMALGHPNPDVRRWVVRLLGDKRSVSATIGQRLRELAAQEADVRVRCQLACSAKRLPTADALPMIERLALRAEDAKDPYLPLLLWWALERHTLPACERVVEFFSSRTAWDAPLIRETISERLLRRYAAEGTQKSFRACARLLASAPSIRERSRLIAALDLGLLDRSPSSTQRTMGSLLAQFAAVDRKPAEVKNTQRAKIPPVLMDGLLGHWKDGMTDPAFLRLMIRLGHRPAQDQAVKLSVDSRTPSHLRLAMLRTLAAAATAECIEPLLKLLNPGESEAVQFAALTALQRFDDPRIADTLLHGYSKMNSPLRSRARAVLFRRKTWALAFLKRVNRGRYPAAEVAVEELRPLALLKDKQLDELVRKHWGNVQPGTSEDKLAEVRRLTNDLRSADGDARAGRELFGKHCASCHRLFGEGQAVGPDLTHANRKDRDYLLVSIVDPSALVRKEYLSYIVQTTDGRVLTGLMADPSPGSVTLVTAKNERITLLREKMESIQESPVSQMPENLLRQLKPQELRDLFRYLQAEQPFSESKSEKPAVLPGTKPLTAKGDLSAQMRAGIDRFISRETERARRERSRYWKRDFSSAQAYARSIAPNRDRLRRMIGLVDARVPFTAPELIATTAAPALLAETDTFRVFAIRWPVLDAIFGEGLLLQPKGEPAAFIVALPDADQTPEQLAGLAAGLPPEGQIARRLAAAGCQVVVPALIDRGCELSGHPDVWMTNQPHREWIYRPAFELGRHIIGYEVQKILALVDWFRASQGKKILKIGVAGYGEGGLLVFYTAAVDSRIDAVLVSGYFDRREQLWREPIYRNVFGLLREFGDAEIASLIAPRPLVIEYSRCPPVDGPPPAGPNRKAYAAPGVIRTPPLSAVRGELERACSFFPANAAVQPAFQLINGKKDETIGPFSTPALTAFAKPLAVTIAADAGKELVSPKAHPALDAASRQRRQVRQLADYTQALIPRSVKERARFWSKAKPTTAAAWSAACKEHKDYFWEEILGRFPPASEPMNPRSRKLLERPKWTAYEVMLDVWPDVFCWGILVVPTDIKDAEKRPVVVCQHGLEGVPWDTLDDDPKSPGYAVYRAFAARLAERGFVTFAPHNCYRGGNDFRQLQRKLHPLKRSLCSIFLAQHDRHLDWLSSLPFVDPSRIGFYGLSYGGFTAVHVPPLLDRYALAISSAEFNDMVRKAAGTRDRYSYPFYNTYEVFEFNKANTFGYGDLAGMMAPRPFMVERGHDDSVAPDEWVASEYAKVRRLYAALGIPERTTIEFFNGGHVINGVGSFTFLHRHLRWPQPRELP